MTVMSYARHLFCWGDDLGVMFSSSLNRCASCEYGDMDARIFNPEPMGLEVELLNLSLPERVIYDPERNILFLNFEGMHVRVVEDVKAIWEICEQRCRAAGPGVRPSFFRP